MNKFKKKIKNELCVTEYYKANFSLLFEFSNIILLKKKIGWMKLVF